MKARCKYEHGHNKQYYIDRGITVCSEWVDDFQAFLAHLGERPSRNHSIDRIDNDKGYVPGNVRWATREVQQNNKSSNRTVEYCGAKMNLSQACRLAGLNVQTVFTRLKAGLSVERALQ
jgi:hypothetical protein